MVMDLLDDDRLLDLRRRRGVGDPEGRRGGERRPGDDAAGHDKAGGPPAETAERVRPAGGWGALRPDETAPPMDAVGPGAGEAGPATPPAGTDSLGEAAQEGPFAPGTCPICRSRPGRMTCRSCGRNVCKSDAWVMFGLCRTCAKEDRIQNWHRAARPEGRNWLED